MNLDLQSTQPVWFGGSNPRWSITPVGRASPVTSRLDRPENRDRETEDSSRTCPNPNHHQRGQFVGNADLRSVSSYFYRLCSLSVRPEIFGWKCEMEIIVKFIIIWTLWEGFSTPIIRTLTFHVQRYPKTCRNASSSPGY